MVRLISFGATLLAMSVAFAGGRVTVLDLGIETGKPGEFGCASAPSSFVRALGGSHDVRVVPWEKIDAEGAFDRKRTDLLVLPAGSLFPADRHHDLVDYLRAGGHLLTTGGYAFDRPLNRVDGKWQAEKPVPNPPKPVAAVPLAIPPAAAWRENTYVGSRTVMTDVTGPDGTSGVRVATPQMRAYNCGVFSLPQMPKAAGALAFRLRGDGRTRCATVEVNEADGTRWQSAPLPISGEWRDYTLVWTDFTFHRDSSTRKKGRGGPDDRIDFSKAVAFCLCIVRSGNGMPGDAMLYKIPRWIEVCDLRTSADAAASSRRRTEVRPMPTINGRAWKSLFADTKGKDGLPPINVFFPYYHYEDVERFANDPESEGLFPRFDMRGRFSGWDASAMLTEANSGHAPGCLELRPLVSGYDGDGRRHGLAGSIVRHYGDAFKGGSWAIFGVESDDLFGTAANDAFLRATVDALLEPVWLSELHPRYVTARVGETAKFIVNLRNWGTEEPDGEVVFSLTDEEGRTALEKTVSVRAKVGCTEVSCEWPVGSEARDYYDLKAEYRRGGRTIDRTWDALAVWKPETVAKGPVLKRDGTLFTIDGKARFALGAQPMMARTQDHAGRSARHQHEEFRQMHEAGLRFARSFWGFGFAKASHGSYETEQLIRSMDATVLYAQKFGIVLYFNPSCVNTIPGIDQGDALATEAKWQRYFAERYRDVPGFMIDIRNEAVLPMKSGRSRAEHAAWFRHWAAEVAAAIWEVRPDLPVSTGWCQGWCAHSSSRMQDPPSCNEPLNFTDCHYYGPGIDFCEEIKKVDRRVLGYPAVVGEFGCAFNPEGIPRQHEYVDNATAERRYVRQALRAFGLGYMLCCNYGWVDQIQGKLSFSFLQRDFYPRPCFSVYQKLNRTLSRLELRQNPPDAVVLISRTRLSEDRKAADAARGGYNLLASTLAWCGANFSCVPEEEAGKLPTDLKLVLKSSDFESLAQGMDVPAARKAVLAALKRSGAFHTRRAEDDEELETYYVPGREGGAWVFWNDGFDRTVTTERAGQRVRIEPQHGHYLEIGPDGTCGSSIGF